MIVLTKTRLGTTKKVVIELDIITKRGRENSLQLYYGKINF